MKALSIRAPWWWFILHGGKDIENRDWSTKLRGRILIHSSKWWNLEEIRDDAADGVAIYRRTAFLNRGAAMNWDEMRSLGGHIVGSVDVVDCVTTSSSPWFFGKFGFVLANPIAFINPTPIKGALGLFEVPNVDQSAIEEQP